MTKRGWGALFLALGCVLGGYWLWQLSHPARVASAEQQRAAQDKAVASAMSRQDPRTVALIESNFARVQALPSETLSPHEPRPLAPAGAPLPLEFTNFQPAIAVEHMSRVMRQYAAVFGGNPIGTNPEITRQLSGQNPKHLNFLDAESGMRVNENGELVDPWGTPYFFHQLSAHEMEIHSAGPDRIMWTSDDLVVK